MTSYAVLGRYSSTETVVSVEREEQTDSATNVVPTN